jgi:hypothetical protein
MAEVEMVPFISWSTVTAAVFIVVAVVYRMYVRKKKI